jgi:ubiquinone/menaquinone biosynthesis C-methylase UbiE
MTTPSSKDTQQFYSGEVVSQYAGMMPAELPKYQQDFERLLDELLPGTILDTAVGTGHMLEALQKMDPNHQVCGVDLSPDMVEYSKVRLSNAVFLKCGDMSALQGIVEDASVSAVLNNFALHHVSEESAKQCFSEWARVLRPNGRLLVSVWEGTGYMDMGLKPGLQVLSHRWTKAMIMEWASEVGLKLMCDREYLETEFGSENT